MQKKRNYCAIRLKPQFWMLDNFIRREQHGKFSSVSAKAEAWGL